MLFLSLQFPRSCHSASLPFWCGVDFSPRRSSNSPKVKEQLARPNLLLRPVSWLESPLVIYTNGSLTPSAAKTLSTGLKSWARTFKGNKEKVRHPDPARRSFPRPFSILNWVVSYCQTPGVSCRRMHLATPWPHPALQPASKGESWPSTSPRAV